MRWVAFVTAFGLLVPPSCGGRARTSRPPPDSGDKRQLDAGHADASDSAAGGAAGRGAVLDASIRCDADGFGGSSNAPLCNDAASPPGDCEVAGHCCQSNIECCSFRCVLGACVPGGGYCTAIGDACASSFECCSGACQAEAGALLGLCAMVAATDAGCH